MSKLNSSFSEKFPFVYNYFSNLVDLTLNNEKKFPQALIFEGADTINQYLFALELARVLNCKKDGASDCDCVSCRWIRANSHPSIINVSQIHFKPEGDETKTIISTKQAREIEKQLLISTDDYRFFIFFSSGDYEYSEDELNDFRKLNYSDEINYSIKPIDYQTFHPSTPNALLKSIEEPPNKTTFIFLTKSKEDILPTIVSRCLTFKLSGKRKKKDYSNIADIIPNYPNISYQDAFNISQNIQDIIKTQSITIEEVLNNILEYLKELLKQEQNLKVIKDIKLINNAIKHSRASMSDKIVLDSLFLRIARGY